MQLSFRNLAQTNIPTTHAGKYLQRQCLKFLGLNNFTFGKYYIVTFIYFF